MPHLTAVEASMIRNSKDLNESNELYSYLDVKKELVTGFSILFSRFEYALKQGGYCQKCLAAKPDWDKFAQDHSELFDTQNKPKLITSTQYILKNPPKRQVQKNGKLDWRSVKNNTTQLGLILRLVRTVRNNLFHGGKFPSGPINDPARNTNLLESCITILRECLSLNDGIQRCFWERSR
jgi:hypothetical protein